MTSPEQSPQPSVPGGDPFVKSAPQSGQVPPPAPDGPPFAPYGTPPGAFGAPPGTQPPMYPLRPDEERMWTMLSHLSFFVLSVLGPLIIMLTLGKRSELVRRQATEALNFHLVVLIVAVVSTPLMLILVGFLTFFAALIGGMAFSVIAAVQAYNGAEYRYPFTYRFVS